MPKLSSPIEMKIITKLRGSRATLGQFFTSARVSSDVYYSRKVGYFLQVLSFVPRVLDGQGRRRPPSEFKTIRLHDQAQAFAALGCLNSNLFYWFITVYSDCRHLNRREVETFPINLLALASGPVGNEIQGLASALMDDIEKNSQDRIMRFSHDTLTVQNIIPKHSKPIIDQIDGVLAEHYGFNDEELDFIVNYDIKFRMGRDAASDDEPAA